MTPEQARRAIALLDLTSLNDADDEAAVAALCRRAVTPFGPVAAVCLWPRFVPLARRLLSGAGATVRVATVINFPAGEDSPAAIAAAARAAVADGADEIDVVAAWRRFQAGDRGFADDGLRACRDACGPDVTLKVILESGAFTDMSVLRAAADAAIAGGADFLKTSTGRREPGATPAAVEVFHDAIEAGGRPVGVKVSGGVRTCAQAAEYAAQAERRMGPAWATPQTFRFGASALLDALLQAAPADGRGG